MPSKPPMPLAEARRKIDDMLEALSSTNSPGFSCHAIDRSIRVISAERINQDGRFATDEEVSKWKFFGRVKFRMQCTENMANQMGNMHGGCVATIVDNLTSMAVYLHVADLEATTPWSFLGVTQSLQVVYLASVPVKEWIEVEVNVLKLGARVVVISCDMYLLDGMEGQIVKRTSSGTHTKINNSLTPRL